jgi:uncharacterized membrane protein YadS
VLIRILLLLLPLILYIVWILHTTSQVKKGKRKQKVAPVVQYTTLGIVLLTTVILAYLTYSFTENRDDAYEAFRPLHSQPQETKR